MARKDLLQREAEFLRQVKGAGAPPVTTAQAVTPTVTARRTPTPVHARKSAPGADFQAMAASPPVSPPASPPLARTDPEALLQAAREEAQAARDIVRRRWIITFGIIIAVLAIWVLFRLVHVAMP